MKSYISLYVFLIIISLISCDFTDNRLKIKNNSNETITFEYSSDTILQTDDTDRINNLKRDKIFPRELCDEDKPGSKNEWSKVIYDSKNKKLNVFIIDYDTLLKYNDLNYMKNNRLYKRYEYSEAYLNKNNWIISYP